VAESTDTTGTGPVKDAVAVTIEDQPIEDRLRYVSGATSLHQRLLSRLISRRRLSERSMNRRYDSWNRVDENCRLYIDLSRSVKQADGTLDTSKKEVPWARSIVVPMSYAILQVYLTQLMGIFTRRDPPLEIHGVGPEDVRPAKLMNAVIAYDQVQNNYLLELYTVLQDAMKYGMGGFCDWWQEDFGYKTEKPKSAMMGRILEMFGQEATRRIWGKRKEYQGVEAWDPFYCYPDPRISLSKIQKGEFIGYRFYRGYLDLLAGSQANGGNYFNIDAIPKTAPKPQQLRSRNRFQASQMNLIGSMDERDKGFHAIDSFVVNIIPNEWDLGPGTRPEKWQFAWVDDTVIIRAHRAEHEHEEYSFSGLESNIDTHVFGNQGSIENLDGLQRFMTWMYNSHIQNQIRFINNRMIYDPLLIEAFDIENPDAAMHVRLTAVGSSLLREGRLTVAAMYQQMNLSDVTTPLVQSVNQMFDFAMRMSGAADQMMGRTTAEKRTLGEISRVGQEGSARMAMHAMMMDIQGMRPLALRWVSNRQQYTDSEMYVRVAGRIAEEFGGEQVKVKPGDLYGNYDYIPRTGPEPPMPGDLGEILFSGLASIMKAPEILALPDKNGKILDIHEFIKESLRDKGIKNIEDFYRLMGGKPGQQPPGTEVQVQSDEQVAQQAQAGNVIPIEEGRRVPGRPA